MSKFRKCAYCGKREYDLSTMAPAPEGRNYRSESHLAHKECLDRVMSKHEAKVQAAASASALTQQDTEESSFDDIARDFVPELEGT